MRKMDLAEFLTIGLAFTIFGLIVGHALGWNARVRHEHRRTGSMPKPVRRAAERRESRANIRRQDAELNADLLTEESYGILESEELV